MLTRLATGTECVNRLAEALLRSLLAAMLHLLARTDVKTVGVTGVATDGICYQKALWGAVDSKKLQAPLITDPDDYFERDHLQFVFGTDELALEDLINLFQKV